MTISTQAQIGTPEPDPGPLVELFDRLDPVAWFITVVGTLILAGVFLVAQRSAKRSSSAPNIGWGLLVGIALVVVGLVWLIFIS